ncbi:MAG: hypothetical protein GC187_00520 [Alphaproteobacteria bacterium]|nr:hypothetical protein [Alphaproteobacteria bacterium]
MSLQNAERAAKAPEGDQRLYVEKEYFQVLNRGIVDNGNPEDPKLIFYRSDSVSSLDRISLADIKTCTSKNDDHIKSIFYIRPLVRFAVSLLIGILLVISPSYIEYITQFIALPENEHPHRQVLLYLIITSILLIGLIEIYFWASFVEMKRQIDLNFANMSKDWETAIGQFLGIDIKTKINGIRTCLLVFRQFIKWRRFANIFSYISVPIIWFFALVYGTIILTLTFHFWREALIGFYGQPLILLLAATVLALLALPILNAYRIKGYLSRVTARKTQYRDPTVQIAVMISELHQRFVEKKMA